MSLPFDFTSVFRKLAHPTLLPVLDTPGARDGGEWEEPQPVAREKLLSAIVLMMTTEDLLIYPEGEVTGGGISITTTEALYFPDLAKDPPETRQSYVVYQKRRYRVAGTGSMMGNTNMHIYHALRSIR